MTVKQSDVVHVFSFQLLLERKNKEVGRLIEETQKSINDLAENINQSKVHAQRRSIRAYATYIIITITEQGDMTTNFSSTGDSSANFNVGQRQVLYPDKNPG